MPRENLSSLAVQTEANKKAEVITAYIEKFAALDGRPVTPQLYAIYIEALSGFEMRRLKKGLQRYLEEGTRWPWPGHLSEMIEDEI